MSDLRVEIVTFNTAERRAVKELFRKLGTLPTSWTWTQNGIIRSTRNGVEEIRHRPLGAQGNVMAGSELVQILVDDFSPDYIIFYGCAGAADSNLLGHAFLIESTSYVSLGRVRPATKSHTLTQLIGVTLREQVKLKNKWLCDTNPRKDNPLPQIKLDQTQNFVNLRAATGLDTAHVAATDKVVTVPLGPVPQPNSAFAGTVYDEGEWSYGQALGFVAQRCRPLPLLIDMESYGIGRTTEVLHVADCVVALRIVTDALADKDKQSGAQEALLKQGLPALAALLTVMIRAARGH